MYYLIVQHIRSVLATFIVFSREMLPIIFSDGDSGVSERKSTLLAWQAHTLSDEYSQGIV